MAGRSFKRGFDPFQGTEKSRSEWFFRRASFPSRDAAPRELERFWENQENFARARGIRWEEAGPFNYAGRVTSLVVDPNHPNRLYAGAAAGGVWMSEHHGNSWKPCWPKFLSHNIGALAMHPSDGNALVCGTGEANLSPDSCPGSGVYSTRDGCMTWTPYFRQPSGDRLSVDSREMFPRRVGAIAFSYTRPARIALGSVCHDESMPAALYLDEGGQGLVPITFWGTRSYNCHAVLFHPRKHRVIYAAISPGGSSNGIWRSDDFGKKWIQLKDGLPRGEVCGRISVAMSRSHPEILYALIATSRKRVIATNPVREAIAVLGVFRSGNGGKNWREIGGSHFARESQLGYNNTICVHPDNPDFVICGGADLHRTTDGGKRWKQITTGERGSDDGSLPDNFVHHDHHAVAIPGGKGGDLIYSGNDGGVAVSFNGGDTWDERPHRMNTLMFYEADVAPSNSTVFGGGAQDTGTVIAGIGAKAATEFTRVLAGDGGWLVFDPADEEHVFGSTSDLNVYRHRRGEPWANGKQLAKWALKGLPLKNISQAERKLRSIAVMEIQPGRRKGPKTVWIGTYNLWCSEDDGRSWKLASPVFDGSAISAIEISSKRPKLMFVGTTQGGIFRSLNGGKTWSGNLAGLEIPKRLITRIETHPIHPANVVVTVGSTSVPGASLTRKSNEPSLPFSHVFRSQDEGETWKDIDNQQLPNVVYNAMAFETHAPYRLFVGGDAGVWVLTGKGEWASITGNIPSVVVSDLIFHQRDRILTAATYGRGIWRLSVPEKFDISPKESGNQPLDPGEEPLASGLMKDPMVEAPVPLSPPDNAVFSNYPRWTDLAWERVPNAIAYIIDVAQGSTVMSFTSPGNNLHFEFASGGSATWRVWALLSGSRRSPGSQPRRFHYTV